MAPWHKITNTLSYSRLNTNGTGLLGPAFWTVIVNVLRSKESPIRRVSGVLPLILSVISRAGSFPRFPDDAEPGATSAFWNRLTG
jgi:hypothetical protein